MRAMRLSIEPGALPSMIEIEKIQGAAYGITVTVRHVGSLSKGSRIECTRALARRRRRHAGQAPSERAPRTKARGECRTSARKRSAHAARIKGAREGVLRTAARTVCLIGWTAANERARTSCRSGEETARKSTTASVQGVCPICGDGRIL
ncbi:hypothetical protein GBP346_A0216 [Burkholderia pseudomallei MSHR346]|nr:hypothetical protein GBP346_A0216 [Burkholderia pseudomallei MSHR346]